MDPPSITVLHMCSISSMVEGSPSLTAHVWLTCTVMSSHVAFPQWCRGAPHVQLTYSRAPHVWLTCMVMPLMCSIPLMVEGSPSRTAHVWLTYGSHVAQVHGNALTCSIPLMVEGSPSRTAHMWELLTCETGHQSEIFHSLIF